MCACYYNIHRIGDLVNGRERPPPKASGLGVSLHPAAGLPTLLGIRANLRMVPAKGILRSGLSRGWSIGRATIPRGASVTGTAVTGQRGYKFS